MKTTFLTMAATAALLALAPAAAHAATVSDPAGDFLATYTGAQGGDLDILSASAIFDGANFHLSAVVNGAIGTTPNVLHVFGIDRGSGTPRFAAGSPSVGANIDWDAVVVLFPDRAVRVVNFQPMGPPVITLLSNAATVSGGSLTLVAPLSLLPTRGFAPEDYLFSMWTRQRVNIAVDSGNFEIADFAPDDSLFRASVPEPATWAMLVGGFGLLGAALRRRRTPLLAG